VPAPGGVGDQIAIGMRRHLNVGEQQSDLSTGGDGRRCVRPGVTNDWRINSV